MIKVNGPGAKTARTVEIALIGCGAVAEILYAKALRQLEEEGLVSTCALVDPNPARTATIAAILRGPCQFVSLAAALSEVSPDLAIIATPHRFHADLVVDCLKKSIAVLCEKPMATTTTECDRMIEAAQRAGRVLAVGHFRRFFPSCQMLKAIISSNLLGRVCSFRFLEGETYSWPAQSMSFFKYSDAGGGVLIDAGAHTLDLLMWWLGDVAELQYEDDAMGGVEANCRLHLKMTSGATGVVQLSRDWPLPNRYVIECEKGWLVYNYDGVEGIELGLNKSEFGMDVKICSVAKTVQPQLRNLTVIAPGLRGCFTDQLRNVLAAVAGREPVRVPGTEARKAVALIEACYRNRKFLDMPWLEQVEIQKGARLARV